MTDLRIDIKALSRTIKEAREDFERDVENGLCEISEYREELRCAIGHKAFLWQAAPKADASSLRAALSTAAGAAMQYGATEAQINYIVALAEQTGDFNILSGGRLTKGEASNIIELMKRDAARA